MKKNEKVEEKAMDILEGLSDISDKDIEKAGKNINASATTFTCKGENLLENNNVIMLSEVDLRRKKIFKYIAIVACVVLVAGVTALSAKLINKKDTVSNNSTTKTVATATVSPTITPTSDASQASLSTAAADIDNSTGEAFVKTAVEPELGVFAYDNLKKINFKYDTSADKLIYSGDLNGVVNYHEDDFDGDGKNELFVLFIKENYVTKNANGKELTIENALVGRMYEKDNGMYVNKAEKMFSNIFSLNKNEKCCYEGSLMLTDKKYFVFQEASNIENSEIATYSGISCFGYKDGKFSVLEESNNKSGDYDAVSESKKAEKLDKYGIHYSVTSISPFEKNFNALFEFCLDYNEEISGDGLVPEMLRSQKSYNDKIYLSVYKADELSNKIQNKRIELFARSLLSKISRQVLNDNINDSIALQYITAVNTYYLTSPRGEFPLNVDDGSTGIYKRDVYIEADKVQTAMKKCFGIDVTAKDLLKEKNFESAIVYQKEYIVYRDKTEEFHGNYFRVKDITYDGNSCKVYMQDDSNDTNTNKDTIEMNFEKDSAIDWGWKITEIKFNINK